MNEKETLILKHQIEEWKCLNEYVNEMDMNFHKTMVIISSILVGVLTVSFNSATNNNKNFQWVIFLIPMGVIALITYVAYQFRITAILRGHLAALEKNMNKSLDKNVHMWNSALVECYLANNNIVNKFMMLPLSIFVLFIMILCGIYSFSAVPTWLFVEYWVLILILVAWIFISLMQNENIRKQTEKEDCVIKMYKEYQK